MKLTDIVKQEAFAIILRRCNYETDIAYAYLILI